MGYAADGLHRRVVVEHDPVATVDLQIHIAGAEHVTVEPNDLCVGTIHRLFRNDRRDAPVRHHQRMIPVEGGTVEDRSTGKDPTPPVHRGVSVAFRGCRGGSGLPPRARATCSTSA